MKKSTIIYIGATFILAIVIFIWGYNFLKGRDLFRNETVFYARYHKVSGLTNSNPVLIHGMQVGQVRKISFTPDHSGDLMVEVVLTKKFPIPKDSKARIINATLLGDKSIDLTLGNSKVLAQSGDTLEGTVEVTLKEEVNSALAPMKARAETILSNVDSLVASISTLFNKDATKKINTSFKDIQQTFHNLNTASNNLNKMIQDNNLRISHTIANMDSVSMTFNSKRDDIGQIVGNLKNISDSLSKADLIQTIAQTKNTIEQVNLLLVKVNKGQGSLGALMTNDSLFRELNKSSIQLNKLLKDIRENPHRYLKFSFF